MNMKGTRLSDTEVQVANRIYVFESAANADAFEQCLRDTAAAQCVAKYPPMATRDAAPSRPGAGITIAPPPGGLDQE
jgi:hypothetical protein